MYCRTIWQLIRRAGWDLLSRRDGTITVPLVSNCTAAAGMLLVDYQLFSGIAASRIATVVGMKQHLAEVVGVVVFNTFP